MGGWTAHLAKHTEDDRQRSGLSEPPAKIGKQDLAQVPSEASTAAMLNKNNKRSRASSVVAAPQSLSLLQQIAQHQQQRSQPLAAQAAADARTVKAAVSTPIAVHPDNPTGTVQGLEHGNHVANGDKHGKELRRQERQAKKQRKAEAKAQAKAEKRARKAAKRARKESVAAGAARQATPVVTSTAQTAQQIEIDLCTPPPSPAPVPPIWLPDPSHPASQECVSERKGHPAGGSVSEARSKKRQKLYPSNPFQLALSHSDESVSRDKAADDSPSRVSDIVRASPPAVIHKLASPTPIRVNKPLALAKNGNSDIVYNSASTPSLKIPISKAQPDAIAKAVPHPLSAAPEMTRTKVASIIQALPLSNATVAPTSDKMTPKARIDVERKHYVDAGAQTHASRQDIKVARHVAMATRGLVDSLQPLLEAP